MRPFTLYHHTFSNPGLDYGWTPPYSSSEKEKMSLFLRKAECDGIPTALAQLESAKHK